MSHIPNSAMPHAKPAEPQEPAPHEPGIARQAVRIATAPAFVAIGLTAIAVSAVRNWLRPAPPAGPAMDQVPV